MFLEPFQYKHVWWGIRPWLCCVPSSSCLWFLSYPAPYPSVTKSPCHQSSKESLTISGTGFKGEPVLNFEPAIWAGQNYTLTVVSETELKLEVMEGSKWSKYAGALILKGINVGDGDVRRESFNTTRERGGMHDDDTVPCWLLLSVFLMEPYRRLLLFRSTTHSSHLLVWCGLVATGMYTVSLLSVCLSPPALSRFTTLNAFSTPPCRTAV